MIRAIALSLVLLFGFGVGLPLVTEYVEGGSKKTSKVKKAKKKKIRKYSKRWWRLYKARQAKRRAILKRKRALRLRQIRIARQRAQARARMAAKAKRRPVARKRTVRRIPVTAASRGIVAPAKNAAPAASWKKENTASASAVQFRVDDASGSPLGKAQISVVGQAVGADEPGSKSRTVGGVPMTSLRRNVIDQMIRENGWVVNDYQKVINGRNVYVVLGQFEAAMGGMQSKIFYFTEVDGRIYSVSTVSPVDSSEFLAAESERVITSLMARSSSQRSALD
jgi:hypothetical protein